MSGEPDGDDGEPTGQALVARELRRHRMQAGLSLGELARRVGYSRTYLSASEKPGAGLISANVVKRIDHELAAEGVLIALQARANADRLARRDPADGIASQFVANASDQAMETAAGGSLAPSVVSVLGPTHTLTVLDEFTQSVIARYELEGPQRLYPEVRALHRLCRELGDRVSAPTERAHLIQVAARQSALLAYMSVNLGRYVDAEWYAFEASMFATAAGDQPLLAWIKGTQSFALYYQQRYVEALTLARVGLTLAGTDGQRVRLLANGVARAAGKLGNKAAVDSAVAAAFELLEADSGSSSMTPCIDFAPYGPARVTANAATAYLSAGDYAQALRFTGQLRDTLVESDSDWSRSLVHLDEASALTLGRDADLDHAAAVGMDALAAVAHKPIASIANRATELDGHLRSHGPRRHSQDFAEALRDWTERVSLA